MAPGRLPTVLLVLLLVGGPTRALADEEVVPRGYVKVPDVHRLEPERAARKLADLGLNIGRVYEIQVPASWRLGLVIQQSPPPGTILRQGYAVHVRISARANGPAAGTRAPRHWPRARLPVRRTVPAQPGVAPAPEPPPRPVPLETVPRPAPRTTPGTVSEGRLPEGRVPAPQVPPRRPRGPLPAPVIADPNASSVPPSVPVPEAEGPVAPEGDNTVPPAVPQAAPPDADLGEPATGSPDAPKVAPKADRTRVPALLGLPIADAEHQARASDMTLYVERIAGHPVGRVLEQAPEPGAGRPPAGVVRVVVAAGGDHLAEVAPAPLVAVREIAVPDLLDRTGPQAERILEDLGLACDLQETPRGPPGRVADQRPAAGTVLPKGATVVVKVAARAPRRPVGPPDAPPRENPPRDASPREAPGVVGDRPGLPTPLAPAAGTALGSEATMSVGFTWKAVQGAGAYVVEVEERGPAGWVANARQVTRKSAVVLEVVRLSNPPGVLRWRVRAVTNGRHGAPSDWVVLR